MTEPVSLARPEQSPRSLLSSPLSSPPFSYTPSLVSSSAASSESTQFIESPTILSHNNGEDEEEEEEEEAIALNCGAIIGDDSDADDGTAIGGGDGKRKRGRGGRGEKVEILDGIAEERVEEERALREAYEVALNIESERPEKRYAFQRILQATKSQTLETRRLAAEYAFAPDLLDVDIVGGPWQKDNVSMLLELLDDQDENIRIIAFTNLPSLLPLCYPALLDHAVSTVVNNLRKSLTTCTWSSLSEAHAIHTAALHLSGHHPAEFFSDIFPDSTGTHHDPLKWLAENYTTLKSTVFVAHPEADTELSKVMEKCGRSMVEGMEKAIRALECSMEILEMWKGLVRVPGEVGIALLGAWLGGCPREFVGYGYKGRSASLREAGGDAGREEEGVSSYHRVEDPASDSPDPGNPWSPHDAALSSSSTKLSQSSLTSNATTHSSRTHRRPPRHPGVYHGQQKHPQQQQPPHSPLPRFKRTHSPLPRKPTLPPGSYSPPLSSSFVAPDNKRRRYDSYAPEPSPSSVDRQSHHRQAFWKDHESGSVSGASGTFTGSYHHQSPTDTTSHTYYSPSSFPFPSHLSSPVLPPHRSSTHYNNRISVSTSFPTGATHHPPTPPPTATWEYDHKSPTTQAHHRQKSQNPRRYVSWGPKAYWYGHGHPTTGVGHHRSEGGRGVADRPEGANISRGGLGGTIQSIHSTDIAPTHLRTPPPLTNPQKTPVMET